MIESNELVANRYHLLDLLGEGGMGQVWRADDTAMNRDVALKFMQHDAETHPSLARRFDEESRITAQLQHPGIVPIHDPQWNGLTTAHAVTLRNQAYTWLTAELQLHKGKSNPKFLERWNTDPDLASIRDPEALAKLPLEERQRWQQLWTDVESHIANSQRQKP